MSSTLLCNTARCVVREQASGLQVIAADNPFRAVTPGQVSAVIQHQLLFVACVSTQCFMTVMNV